MIHVTRPDVEWLAELWKLAQETYEDYPELYSDEQVETLKVSGELIRSLKR